LQHLNIRNRAGDQSGTVPFARLEGGAAIFIQSWPKPMQQQCFKSHVMQNSRDLDIGNHIFHAAGSLGWGT
jgi:hypothetical protein